jgi:hypothetical protein
VKRLSWNRPKSCLQENYVAGAGACSLADSNQVINSGTGQLLLRSSGMLQTLLKGLSRRRLALSPALDGRKSRLATQFYCRHRVSATCHQRPKISRNFTLTLTTGVRQAYEAE